jgi:hypothetical protein
MTMRVRELPNWPPEPGGAYRPGSIFPSSGEAIIAEVVPLQGCAVTFRATHGQDSHSYHYQAETKEIAEQLQRLMEGNVGRAIATLGEFEIEISGMSDSRIAGMLLLDKKFAAYGHITTRVNDNGHYELRCFKCEAVGAYSGAAANQVDVQTFAFNFIARHRHDGVADLHPTFLMFVEEALDGKHSPIECLQALDRETERTEIANELLERAGDLPGLRLGEQYLAVLRQIRGSGKLPKG